MKLSAKQIQELNTVMQEAMASGDIRKALEKSGKGLPKEVSSVLEQLTSEDLKMAATLNNKLVRLKDLAAHTGNIGM
jgi:hypothetical protein